jgi:hypothetical protein
MLMVKLSQSVYNRAPNLSYVDIAAAAELKDIDMLDSFFSDDEQDLAMATTVQPVQSDYMQQEEER